MYLRIVVSGDLAGTRWHGLCLGAGQALAEGLVIGGASGPSPSKTAETWCWWQPRPARSRQEPFGSPAFLLAGRGWTGPASAGGKGGPEGGRRLSLSRFGPSNSSPGCSLCPIMPCHPHAGTRPHPASLHRPLFGPTLSQKTARTTGTENRGIEPSAQGPTVKSASAEPTSTLHRAPSPPGHSAIA